MPRTLFIFGLLLAGGTFCRAADTGVAVPPFTVVVSPGTADLQHTIDTAAAQALGHPFQVILSPGRYSLPSPLRITEQHSHLTLTGRPGALLEGGIQLPPFTDGGNGVWSTSIASLPPYLPVPTALVVNGSRRIRARMPNALNSSEAGMYTDNTTMHARGPLVNCSAPAWGSCPEADKLGFLFDPQDPLGVPNPAWNYTDAAVLIFASWYAIWAPVGSVVADNNTLLFATPTSAEVGPFGVQRNTPGGGRWILENMRELLDAPWEFWIDQDARQLLYIPEAGETVSNTLASVPNMTTIISIEGSSPSSPVVNVTVQGIEISTWGENSATARYGSEPSYTGGVQIQNAGNINILNVRVHSGPTSAIVHHANVNGLRIDRVNITDVGGDGVNGYVSSPNVTDVSITNCVINNIGNVYLDQPAGIQTTGHNISVQHNLIYDVPYAGIFLGLETGTALPPSGANVTPANTVYLFDISYNRVDNYGLGIMNDLGGIYAANLGYCWPTNTCWNPANIHHNVISRGRHYNYGSTGVYVDQDMAGVWIHHNIVFDTGSVALQLHCGMNNTAENNIWYGPEVQTVNTKTGVLGGCNTFGFPPGVTSSTNFSNNIVVATQTAWAMDGQFPDAYCWVGHNDWFADNNVWWGTGAGTPPLHYSNGTVGLPAWRAVCGADIHSVEQDPLLADPEGGNFTVMPDSPAWALGWQAIDTSTVGPQ